MSCEMRSMITRYPLGSAIFTPPSFTNSAVTPGTFMLLIFSTTAGGNVFSMPKMMPIFLSINISHFDQIFLDWSDLSVLRVLCGERGCAIQARFWLEWGFLTLDDQRLKEVLSRHPQPQRPIMPGVVVVNIQPVRDRLAVQHRRHLHVLVQAHVPVRRSQHNFHLPVAAQKPVVVHVWQIVHRTVEVTIVVVIA